MANKSYDERNVRKLIKLGNGSIGLTLPIEEVKALKWREKQKVIVKREGKKFIIVDWKK